MLGSFSRKKPHQNLDSGKLEFYMVKSIESVVVTFMSSKSHFWHGFLCGYWQLTIPLLARNIRFWQQQIGLIPHGKCEAFSKRDSGVVSFLRKSQALVIWTTFWPIFASKNATWNLTGFSTKKMYLKFLSRYLGLPAPMASSMPNLNWTQLISNLLRSTK